jgi:5'-nucleotidase
VRVTILHFSDYHSHALPFYSEGRDGQGGIARAIGYLERERRGALVFSGGDMVNKGSPSWSDKFGCAEWRWFNGIVDAMALGNHDVDYGPEAFARCRASITYPILSANTEGFPATRVFTRNAVRIGVFALAGDDFASLTKGLRFTDRVAAAREAVASLRRRADAIVMIGHETTEEDYALAREVPGIDLILGTHSHLKRGLTKIEGTDTWFIAPSQYLTYVSRVVLSFDNHALEKVTGGLVPVDSSMRESRRIAARVASMQKELERDPRYAELFRTIATLPSPLPEAELAARVVTMMRERAEADVALSTKSSFRQPLPPGALTMETLRGALPYDNEIVVVEVSGAQLRQFLAREDVYAAGPAAIQDERVYRLATTDYFARVAGLKAEPSGLRVREEFRKTLVGK